MDTGNKQISTLSKIAYNYHHAQDSTGWGTLRFNELRNDRCS